MWNCLFKIYLVKQKRAEASVMIIFWSDVKFRCIFSVAQQQYAILLVYFKSTNKIKNYFRKAKKKKKLHYNVQNLDLF